MKTCSKCQAQKSVEDFYAHKGCRDGLAGSCKTCANAAALARQKANPAKHNESSRLWRKANPEKARMAIANWNKANPGRKTATDLAWNAANPERVRELKRSAEEKRRAVKIGVDDGTVTPAAIAELIELHEGLCAYCGDPGRDLDHIEPLSKGGLHTITNLLPACRSCNSSKGNKSLAEWLEGSSTCPW